MPSSEQEGRFCSAPFLKLVLLVWSVTSVVIPWTVASGLLCPWACPSKNTGVGCRLLLQGIFPTQGSNPHLLGLLCCKCVVLPLAPPGKPLEAGVILSHAHPFLIPLETKAKDLTREQPRFSGLGC